MHDEEGVIQELMRLSDPAETRQQLQDTLLNDSMPDDDRTRRIYVMFKRLRNYWGEDSNGVLEAILHIIIPILRRIPSDNDTQMYRYQIRRMVPEFLDRLSQVDRVRVRAAVLEYIQSNLLKGASKDSKLAHTLIGSIGYRDQKLFHALLDMMSNEEAAPSALATILTLRVPEDYRKQLRPRLLQAIRLAEHSAFEMQEAVKQAWLDDEIVAEICSAVAQSNETETPGSILLTILGRLAAQTPSSGEWQEQAWNSVCNRQINSSTETMLTLTTSAGVASSINHPNVIRDILSWAAAQDFEKVNPVALYRLFNRLSECVRPDHLAGWTLASQHKEPWIELIRASAIRNTGAQGRYTTSEMELKERAWEAALCLGLTNVGAWSVSAIESETSPYVAQLTMQQLACIENVPISPHVVNLIRRRYDLRDNEESGEFFRQAGAITLAHSIGGWESLSALANAGLTSNNHALLSTCKSLADVAVACANENTEEVTEFLISKVRSTDPAYQRDAALHAMRELSRRSLLATDYSSLFLSLAQDGQLASHSRVTAIETLRFLQADDVQSIGVVEQLLDNSEPDDIRYAAADYLVSVGGLSKSNSADLPAMLGLSYRDEAWQLDDTPSERAVFTIGLLYAKQPSQTRNAVVDLINRTGEWVIYSLFGSDRVTAKNVLPEIIDAVVERIKTRTSPIQVETPLFQVLSILSPSALLGTKWEETWQRWHADGRLGLIEAIGAISPQNVEQPERLYVLCKQLLGDGHYSVRRAAYKTLANNFPNEFEKIVVETRTGSDVELRKRSAEACAWLPGKEDLPTALSRLLQDPEPEVRKIAESARDERLERRWATVYLQVIKNGLAEGVPVSNLYKFGHALEKIGDDEVENCLTRWLDEPSLRPNQKIWLRRVIERTNKRWRKVTSEWPKPWIRLRGVIEELDAVYTVAGNSQSAKATLWRVPSSTPNEPYSWGGIVTPANEVSTADQMAGFFNNECQVAFPGRSETEILVVGTLGKSGGIFFSGNGPYPESL